MWLLIHAGIKVSKRCSGQGIGIYWHTMIKILDAWYPFVGICYLSYGKFYDNFSDVVHHKQIYDLNSILKLMK